MPPTATTTTSRRPAAAPVLATTKLTGVEILAPGVWNGDTYTVADLEQMAATFAAGNTGIVPPAKLGHNPEQRLLAADGLPAAGYVERLYVEDDRLKADFRDVPKRLASLIRARAYSTVSAEVYFNLLDAATGVRIPRVLKAVSFLGADVPAVTSLAGIEALYGARADAVIAYYAAAERSSAEPAASPNTDAHPDMPPPDGDLRVYELPADMSHDDLRTALRDALLATVKARMPFAEVEARDVWVVEVYESAAIVCADGGATYRVAYAVAPDGHVTLGAEFVPVKRVTVWQPVIPEPDTAAAPLITPEMAGYSGQPALAGAVLAGTGTAEQQADEDFAAVLAALLERMEARHKGAKGMPALRVFAREMRAKLAALRGTAPPGPQEPAALNDRRGASGPEGGPAQEETMNPELLKVLGLAADADAEAALGRARELTAALETARTAVAEAQLSAREGQYASLEEYRTLQNEVGTLKAELSRRDAQSAVERAVSAGKVVPAQREWAESYAAKDPDGFRAYVAAAPAFPLGQPVGSTGARADAGSATLTDSDRTVARQLGLAEERLLAFKEQATGTR